MGQWNQTEKPELDQHKYAQLIFGKGSEAICNKASELKKKDISENRKREIIPQLYSGSSDLTIKTRKFPNFQFCL